MKSEKSETLNELAEEELHRAHDKLETRIKERTAELIEANEALQAEITERKRVEQALLESEQRYRSLFENMLDGFAYCKMFFDDHGHPVDFVYLKVNSAFERLTGLEKVVGKKVTEVIPGIKELYPELFEIYGRVALMGKPEKFEIEIKPLEAWLSISVYSTKREYFVAVFENITERKRIEKELQKERDRAQNYLDIAGVMFVALDANQKIILMNKKCCEILGCKEEEVIGKNWFDNFIPERIRHEVEAVFVKLMAGKIEPVEFFENPVLTKNGEERLIAWHNTALKYEADNITCILSSGEDITERKRAEEALQQSEERFSKAFRSSPVALNIARLADGHFVDANESFLRLLEYSREEVIDHISTELNMYVDPNEQAQFIRILLEQGTISNYEVTLRTKTGKLIRVLFSAEMISLNGQDHIISTLIDITERKRAEEALRESEERHRLLAETMLQGVVHQDADGKIISMNPAAEWILGKSPEEFLGGTSVSVEHNTVREDGSPFPGLEHPSMVALRTGQKIKDVVMGVYNPREQGYRWINISAVPLFRQREDRPHQVYTVFEDITERKLAEEALYKARDELETRIQERTAELEEANLKLKAEIEERERSEKALQRSEMKYRRLAESIGEVFYALDKDLRYIYWNNASEKLTGISAQDAIGKSLFELFPELKGSRTEKLYREVLKTQRPKRFVNKYRANGKNLIFEINAYYSKYGISVIAKDITERRRAEEEIYLLQTMTQAINEAQDFHSAIEVVLRKVCEATGWDYGDAWFPSKDGTVLECGPAWYSSSMSLERFRKFSEQFTFQLGTGLAGRVWASKKAEWVQDLSTCSVAVYPRARIAGEAGLKSCVGVPIIINDQMLAVLIFYMFESGEEDKRLVGTISAMATQLGSIIQRKQAEEKIREQATLLDNAQEAIGVRSLEHSLMYWNKGAERLYGWTADEAIGKNPVEFLFKDKKEPHQLIEAKRTVLEKGGWIGELHQITKDGRDVIVESHWTLIRDSEGKPKSILIVNTDITEKKKFESQLLRAQRMEGIGTLASGIAHDLNNVLTPIMLSLQMLKEKYKDEQSQKILTILDRNLQRGSNLIKQVMSFARGIEGERKLLQAAHIISEIEKVITETFNKNIEIRTDISEDLFTISGDATQLYQVIMNMCVNARDAMPDGGVLEISARNFLVDENYARMNTEAKVGPYIIISVSDTGTGIPPKIMDRIFEPFFTTKEPGKGTGLGLSTSLGIVKSHGGFINVNSEVGEGTIFKIYLPAFKTEVQGAQMQQPELLTGQGEMILVAEDEGSIREITCSTLETYGYEVIAAEDGAQAVAEYAQNTDKVKVILMDMMMPVMDGQASIRAVRKINPDIKIIGISGLTEKDKLRDIANHTNAFLPKPYTAEVLLRTVHEVLSAE